MKTIFVPTDYSKEAKSALWYALEMALVSKAQVVLFHAFHQPIFSPFLYDEEAIQRQLEEQKLVQLMSYAKETIDSFCKYFTLLSGSSVNAFARADESAGQSSGESISVFLNEEKAVSVSLVCKYGLTEAEILKATRLYAAELVVMGMRGAGPVSQALLGSTTLAIIQENKVPVLAVPLQARFGGLSSVVLAVDPAKLPGADTLNPLCRLTATFNSRLAVLQLYKGHPGQQQTESKLHASGALKTCLPNVDFRLYAGQHEEDIAAGIQQFLEAKQADLLVLVPQKHNIMSRLRNKSITGKMAAKAQVPLLALPCIASKTPALQEEPALA